MCSLEGRVDCELIRLSEYGNSRREYIAGNADYYQVHSDFTNGTTGTRRTVGYKRFGGLISGLDYYDLTPPMTKNVFNAWAIPPRHIYTWEMNGLLNHAMQCLTSNSNYSYQEFLYIIAIFYEPKIANGLGSLARLVAALFGALQTLWPEVSGKDLEMNHINIEDAYFMLIETLSYYQLAFRLTPVGSKSGGAFELDPKADKNNNPQTRRDNSLEAVMRRNNYTANRLNREFDISLGYSERRLELTEQIKKSKAPAANDREITLITHLLHMAELCRKLGKYADKPPALGEHIPYTRIYTCRGRTEMLNTPVPAINNQPIDKTRTSLAREFKKHLDFLISMQKSLPLSDEFKQATKGLNTDINRYLSPVH